MTTPFIFTDLSGTRLTLEEKHLLSNHNVLGVILFARNYESKEQLLTLTNQIKKIRSDALIAVDQEGGRVQRFREEFTALPSMHYWGSLIEKEGDAVLSQLVGTTETMVTELHEVGVDLNLMPVLDIDYGLSEVIGERSFSRNPDRVSTLAKTLIDTMHAHCMPVTGKHFPGHGGVQLDSHTDVPIDGRERELLWEQDIKPYRDLASDLDLVMPAHVIYPNVDSKPAGFSVEWLSKILRQDVGFDGLIISDDLSMQGAAALGGYIERVNMALTAGCNILTICNNRKGALEVIDFYKDYKNQETDEKIIKYIRNIM